MNDPDTFDAEAFIHVARDLLDSANTTASREAQCRTAAGRAYYAVYGLMRMRMCDAVQRDVFRGAGNHGKVAKGLKWHGTTPLKRIAPYFNVLLDYREKSDYDYATRVDEDDANDAISKAEWILGRIRTLRSHHYRGIASQI